MPDSRKAIYWDANCWLSYINAIPDRLPILDSLLDASYSESGDIRLFSSALSKVEEAFSASEQQQRVLDTNTEELIEDLWHDPGAVVTVEFHDAICGYRQGFDEASHHARLGLEAAGRNTPGDGKVVI